MLLWKRESNFQCIVFDHCVESRKKPISTGLLDYSTSEYPALNRLRLDFFVFCFVFLLFMLN